MSYLDTHGLTTLWNKIKSYLQTALDSKIDKVNPTGTGSFSLNRNADSTIGTNSFAEGSMATASGFASHAEGSYTTAEGDWSHAEGSYTTAEGDCSHAEGEGTTASGGWSHAEGQITKASGSNSHAEGRATIASGSNSHAEGRATIASGYYSHAEGEDTTASGSCSHAEGEDTTASGSCSHAEGWGTEASSYGSHAQGRYNVANTSHADIVGNGANMFDCSNAYALDWDGNGYFAGDVYVGCNADSSGGTKVLTEHQDISGKENTSNKVTAWSSTTTDTHYPSEKLVKTALDGKANSSHTQAASTITGLATVATSGSYNDLSNKPTIPSAVNKLSAQTQIDGDTNLDNFIEASALKYATFKNSSSSGMADYDGMVISIPWSNTNYGSQIAFDDAQNPRVKVRGKSSTWGGWKELLHEGNLSTFLATVATSGSYNDLSNKPTIPSAVTESTVSGWGFTKNTGTYSKPSGGIPKTDLASAVQTSLGKADTALQSAPVTSVNSKTGAVSLNASDVGAAATSHTHTKSQITDFPTLATVATSGSYNDLSNKPTIPPAITVDTAINSTSTNPVQNKVIKTALDNKMDKSNPTGTGSFSLNRKASTTIGNYSFAEGYTTTASGDYSHAEGYTTTAEGDWSHAEGFSTTASGDGSHAEGAFTTASGDYSHAQGIWNVDNENHADIVGNGTADDARSNAYALDWSGNGHFAGDVYVGCNADSSGGTKLAKITDIPVFGVVSATDDTASTISANTWTSKKTKTAITLEPGRYIIHAYCSFRTKSTGTGTTDASAGYRLIRIGYDDTYLIGSYAKAYAGSGQSAYLQAMAIRHFTTSSQQVFIEVYSTTQVGFETARLEVLKIE